MSDVCAASLVEVTATETPQTVTWKTSPDYLRRDLAITTPKFLEVTNLLLERPNLNSSHLFRADILYDSSAIFQTVAEKERSHGITSTVEHNTHDSVIATNAVCPAFEGYYVARTIIRRLIPRNPQLDKSLDQSCFILESKPVSLDFGRKHMVVYRPHIAPGKDLPWYHPNVQALAYLFEEKRGSAQLSVHYKPRVDDSDQSLRLHRTMLSLLQTFTRLAKLDSPSNELQSTETENVSTRSTAPSALKDTVLPQHLVQNTYARLKQTYASQLMSRWVEKTEPSKHVFEDLSIAAFLIELWKQMYAEDDFPGFVDLACGNGVLVYILIKEGYRGYGLDAKRRKTWQMLDIHDKLEEKLCIPKPFLDLTTSNILGDVPTCHDGMFAPDTFIISNHADELTPWTPLLAFLSNPLSPLPFLAIPCCSHALSGAQYRYKPKDIDTAQRLVQMQDTDTFSASQTASGDLRALRKEKQAAVSHKADQSQYSCLTKKVVALTEELGIQTEMTLMRIPSTRNIGIVGNRKNPKSVQGDAKKDQNMMHSLSQDVQHILERECAREGGIQVAANIWVARARKLQTGAGRGKVNLGAGLGTNNDHQESG